ncbi:MAG TPA: amidohydrolase family protein [Candidatus Cybelea sp.]|nr:amidohydrolase family protein [Candidatus Cybelea sp.]
MATLFTGGTLLTVNAANEIARADLRIEGKSIAAIGPAGSLSRPGDSVIDCSGTLIMPGLVNVHTHAGTAFFRGLADDKPREFWSAYAVPGQERFTVDHYVQSAGAAAAEFLLHGVTCIADRLGFMDRIAPALESSGIRAVVGHTLSDAKGPADWSTAERMLDEFGANPERRVHAGLAPHALDSCSDDLLSECARKAAALDCRIFIHVAQSEAEVADIRRRGYRGALDCLVRNDLGTPNVVAAHGIYLTDEEIDAWPRYGIPIAHCPASNLKIEARTLAIHRLIGKVPIGLGTDWTVTNNSMDLFSEARLAALVGKMLADDPAVLTVRQMLRMLTIDGARVLGLGGLVGSIEAGKRADLIVLDLDRLDSTPRHDPESNVVYAMGARTVRDVWVDGECVVRTGRLTRQDETTLARRNARLGALP